MRVETEIEQHEFTCESCIYVWQVTYEVRDPGSAKSDLRHYRYLTGLPASSPLQGRRCPNCWEPTFSSHRIDVQPSALSHHRRARALLS